MGGEGRSAARLGDFRIGREVGRGGMGIVVRSGTNLAPPTRRPARCSPSLPPWTRSDFQRFQNEARAAAQLHHTNIVPVYFVGCERGVHFYAMQFIDGNTLGQLIQALQPEDRRPARRHAGMPTWGDCFHGGDGGDAQPSCSGPCAAVGLAIAGRQSRSCRRAEGARVRP